MSTCYYIERLGGYARVWTPDLTDRPHARWRACGADRRERTRKEVSASFYFFFTSASTEKTKAPSAVLVACLREYGHLWNPHGVFGKVFGLIRTIFTDRTRGTARNEARATTKNVRNPPT